MWTSTHFPAAMRSLSPRTRAKAIEIANKLMADGAVDKYTAVSQSVSEARSWARLEHESQNWTVSHYAQLA